MNLASQTLWAKGSEEVARSAEMEQTLRGWIWNSAFHALPHPHRFNDMSFIVHRYPNVIIELSRNIELQYILMSAVR